MSIFEINLEETGIEEAAADELDETPATVQQAAPTVNTEPNAGEKGADDDLDARVAALLMNKSATNWNDIQAFMAAVVPWPVSSNDAGWVNLHWSFPDKNSTAVPKTNVLKGGKPYKDIADFIKDVAWRLQRPEGFKDMFFCTSMQRDHKTNPNGTRRAAKSGAAALALKSIWVDIDVKAGDPKHYHTEAEALKAILLFAKTVGLPEPSAIVRSGGGLHIYWISREALTPQEWLPYAQGLKNLLIANTILADTAITTDAARILRIPGTLNHKPKYPQPMPVELIDLSLKTYDFPSKLAFLHRSTGPTVAPTAAPGQHSIWAEGVDPASFRAGPSPLFKGLLQEEPGLSAGIDKFADNLVNAMPIFRKKEDGGCGFYREAFATGGKNHNQPLWNLAVLGSTFMENGNAIAHAISKGHAEYSEVDTQALYDRKMAERHDRGIGYPSCATFEANGSSACATCPLRAKGKSPLNIRPVATATVTNGSSPSGSSSQANWTPRPGISFSKIPHRKWLYGSDLVRGETTVIGSPGGAGKSSLAIGMAICAATNRDLLGEKIRGGSNLKALVVNGEDSTDEIRRRVFAFCLAHGIVEGDLKNLTFVGADDAWVQQISFLTTNEKGASAFNQSGLDALQRALDALHPDVIVLDPLVSFCGGGNMNDNAVMSLAMRRLKEIAARYKCAVLIVHHTRKGGDAGNVETISGAAAITNLARRAIMPAPLTDDDGKRFGILPSERPQYFKLVDAKSNLVPRAADSPLYRLHSVELPNPEPPLYPNGDNVQAITRVVLPIQPSGAASADDMKIEGAIFALVDRGKEIDGQAYPYSPSLAGKSNERELLPDAMVAVENATAPRQWRPDDLKAVITAAIDKMLADGRLVVEDMKDLTPKPGRFRRGRGLKAVPI
jgi:AAA domain